MKSTPWGLVLLAVGLVVGMLVGGGLTGRQAEAQVAGPVQPRSHGSKFRLGPSQAARVPGPNGAATSSTP